MNSSFNYSEWSDLTGHAIQRFTQGRGAASATAHDAAGSGTDAEAGCREAGGDPAAVCQWAEAHREGGDNALETKPHLGPKPKLNQRRIARLEKLLLQGPRKHDYATELWTLRRVAELIENRFGVTCDPSGVWHLLTRMGWSAQKPEHRARERDEDAIAT